MEESALFSRTSEETGQQTLLRTCTESNIVDHRFMTVPDARQRLTLDIPSRGSRQEKPTSLKNVQHPNSWSRETLKTFG